MLEEFFKAIIELITATAHVLISSQEQLYGYAYWLKLVVLTVSLAGAAFYAYYWGRRALHEKIHQILVDPDAFWSKAPQTATISSYRKQHLKSLPIITIANYKGGVGKSMISTNLAAYLDMAGLRVLLLDYDYQGSLTDIVPYRNPDHIIFSAHDVLQGDRESQVISPPEKLGGSFHQAFIHPAESGLSKIDSSLIYQWLTGKRKTDIRFNTQNYLTSEKVNNNYDIVLIDTPPRICAATANALCAATHVLMPTILDTVSSRAVFRSVEMFLDFRDKLHLGFKMLGVVPSKVQRATGYTHRESQALSYLIEELYWHYKDRINKFTQKTEPVKVLDALPIMQKVDLLHIEGDDMVIFERPNTQNQAVIREMFSRLGEYIIDETGLNVKVKTEDNRNANLGTAQPIVEFGESAQARAG